MSQVALHAVPPALTDVSNVRQYRLIYGKSVLIFKGGAQVKGGGVGKAVTAESISTGDIYVTYRKERPIGAIGAVRARAGTRALMPCIVLHLGRTLSTCH